MRQQLPARRMRIIACNLGREHGAIAEKTMIEKGAFEKGMDKEVKGVPNVEEAELSRRGRGEEIKGGAIGGYKKKEYSEKREEGGEIDGGQRRRRGRGRDGHCDEREATR